MSTSEPVNNQDEFLVDLRARIERESVTEQDLRLRRDRATTTHNNAVRRLEALRAAEATYTGNKQTEGLDG